MGAAAVQVEPLRWAVQGSLRQDFLPFGVRNKEEVTVTRAAVGNFLCTRNQRFVFGG